MGIAGAGYKIQPRGVSLNVTYLPMGNSAERG